MIEQPLAPGDLIEHARLQRRAGDARLPRRVASTDLDQLDTALTLGAGRVINIKVCRMGGLLEAKAVHDRAVAAGWPVWCGGMHEFGVGRAANVAIAACPASRCPATSPARTSTTRCDVVEPPIRAERGHVPVPRTPGLGHEVDEPLVRRLASESVRFTASPGDRPAGPS